MAVVKQKIKTDILLDVNGLVTLEDDHAALLRAQERNAKMLVEHVKMRAAMEVGKGLHPETPSGTRDYPGHMADWYFAEVDPATGDITLDNPTQRSVFFEFGTQEHEIWASGLFERGRQTPARGSRGQFSKGAEALAFEFIGYDDDGRDFAGFFIGEMVNHPGQDANPIMEETVDATLDDMADVILDELTGALFARQRSGIS